MSVIINELDLAFEPVSFGGGAPETRQAGSGAPPTPAVAPRPEHFAAMARRRDERASRTRAT